MRDFTLQILGTWSAVHLSSVSHLTDAQERQQLTRYLSAGGSTHGDPAADGSQLGPLPEANAADWDSEDGNMSDMALEDAIQAAHHRMAPAEVDDDFLSPEHVDLSNDSSAAEPDDWSHDEGPQAKQAVSSAVAHGVCEHEPRNLYQQADPGPADTSDMTFLAQLRSANNMELSSVGSEDEDGQSHLRDTDGAVKPEAHFSTASAPERSPQQEATGSTGTVGSRDEADPEQLGAEEGLDEAARIAAWQAYWQSQYKAGAYQPPPQGPPGLPISSLHPDSSVWVPSNSSATAVISGDTQHSSGDVRGHTDATFSDKHSVELQRGALGRGQEVLDQSALGRGGAEAAAPSSFQDDCQEAHHSTHSPAASAWQPWLEWWHGIAGNCSASATNRAAEASASDRMDATDNVASAGIQPTASGQLYATDPSASAEVWRPSLQPGHATRHVGDKELIAVPISLLKRYQQLEWEDWVRRWQAWHTQQMQPAVDGCR